MFIAFEGPDNTGKSTSAASLSADGEAIYNITKERHAEQQTDPMNLSTPELVVAYDRIDWFTHMVYRLAMPDREWNDARIRTVFAMPDTHLVVKLHRPDLAPLIDDELYETGKLAEVNPMYWYFAEYFMKLNKTREYSLFKTVSIVEVSNDPRDGSFSQRLMMFDSPAIGWEDIAPANLVTNDETLLELLRYEEQHHL